MNARKPGCNSSARAAACSNSGRQPDTDSALARAIGKSRPARCIFASAWPTPAQCAALGLRGQMPSRKLMMAAGRPASALSASPLLFFTGCGQLMPRRGEMRHQAEKERQVALGDALFIQRQDEISGAGVQQEVGILDALGDALVGQQFADVVTAQEIPQARRRRRRCKPPSRVYSAASGRSERGSGKNSFSSAAETVSTCNS